MIVELENQTIPALLQRSFSLYHALPAVAYVGEGPTTYGGLKHLIETLSSSLLERGVGKGVRVALLGENSPGWVIAYLAVTSVGGVVVPILPGFTDQDTRHIIRDSECVAAFLSERQRPKVEGAELPDLHTVFSLDGFQAEDRKTIGEGLAEKARHLLGLRSGPRGSAPADVGTHEPPSEDDLAAIIYTSGTTGHSKGVMLTHRNIVSDAVGSVERFPIDSTDRFLSILPLSHAYEATGGMLCPLAVGASVFYMKGLPAPSRLISAMQTVRPTAVLMVPLVMDAIYRKRVLGMIKARKLEWLYRVRVFRKLLNRVAGRRLISALGGCLRFFMLGGAALNEDLELFLRDAGIGYSTGYGMTEASPIVTINPFEGVRIGSCGKPIPGVEIRIQAPDETTDVGEILLRGPNMMKGYYKNDEATAEVFLEGGWFRSGDLGSLDREGYLYIRGRSKNVIVGPSGENIYPEIVEQQLQKSPYVLQAIVYERETKLVARVYLDQDVLDREFGHLKLDDPRLRKMVLDLLEDIRITANSRLPAFSVIHEILEHPEPFELTPTNKVKRYLYVS
jgi:long-chain acyl-CoA synthetase